MDKKQKAEEKAIEIDNILARIKEGIYEIVPVTSGISPVWKTFVKLRHSTTKVFIEYVKCRNCKGLVPYHSRSGTSNLLKHKCKTLKEEAFKNLPDEKVANVKQFLMDKIIACSAEDFCPIEYFCGTGFLKMAQSLVALGDKHGNIDVKSVHPNLNAINRQIAHVKEETRQTLLDTFKKAYNRSWCSTSVEVCKSNGIVKKSLLATFSLHFFDEELTALRKIPIFAIGIDPDDEPQTTLEQLQRSFNIFGGDEIQLHAMKIVSPNNSMMKTILNFNYNRQDCIIYKINTILDASLNISFNKTNDFNELIKNCRSIVRYIKDSGKSHQLEIEVKIDNGTWTSKIEMLDLLKDQYDNVMEILDEDKENTFVLNKKLIKEIVSFVSPFLEAADDLVATEYPTANRIVLWWALLNSHLQDIESCSFWMKNVMKKAQSIFDIEFHPSTDNKIDCFLDPRYRWLKMFPQTERDTVYEKVRDLLQDVEVHLRVIPSCSSKEPLQPSPKKSRFSKFESSKMDIDTNDEVSMYLQSADVQRNVFELEFNLIGIFWKSVEEKFPKLFRLATSRLNVPASCGSLNPNEYVEQKLTLDKLNDLMLISSSLNANK